MGYFEPGRHSNIPASYWFASLTAFDWSYKLIFGRLSVHGSGCVWHGGPSASC